MDATLENKMESVDNIATPLDDYQHTNNCSLCQKIFTDPKILPCFHSYCSNCLHGYTTQHARSNKFTCPLCGMDCHLPAGGVNNLQTNLYIKAALTKSTVAADTACEVCDNETRADNSCLECEQNLCVACSRGHLRMTSSREHHLVSLKERWMNGEGQVMSKAFCEKHRADELSFYCHKCSLPICLRCKITAHEQHATRDLSDVATETRTSLQEMLKGAQTLLPTLHGHLTDVTAYNNHITAEGRKRRDEISRQTTKLYKYVDKMSQELTDTVEDEMKVEAARLEIKRDQIGTKTTALSAQLHSANQVVGYGSDADITRNKETIAEQLRRITKIRPEASIVRLYMEFRPGDAEHGLNDVFGKLTRMREPDDKVTGRRKPADTNSFPDDTTRWQYQQTNWSHPYIDPTNQKPSYNGSSTYQQSRSKGLSSVSEYEETQSDVLPRKYDNSVSTLPQSFTFDKAQPQGMSERVKSRSNNELYTANYRSEINNNLANQNQDRLRGPPPNVPKRTTANGNKVRNDNSPKSEVGIQQNGDKNNNRPDLISSVTGNKPEPQVRRSPGRTTDTENVNTRVKHDSGCHSDLRISNDELYSPGYNSTTNAIVTNNASLKQISSAASNHRNGHSANSQRTNNHGPNSANVKSRNDDVKSSHHNGTAGKTAQSFTDRVAVKGVQNVRAEKGVTRPDTKTKTANKGPPHNSTSLNSKSASYNGRQVSKPDSTKEALYAVPQKPPRTFAEESKNLNNFTEKTNKMERDIPDESVTRSCSVGDLTAGCAFSLVGQKKSDSIQVLPSAEFTGSQMTKHFRKYREIKQERKHDSLPFRGKSDSDMRAKLESLSLHCEEPSKGDNSQSSRGGNLARLAHYSSLQHLPNETSNRDYNRHVLPTRTHQKTPMKPRRALPQVPSENGNIDDRKRHFSDLVKIRMSLSSRSSNSPGSGTNSSESRQEIIRETPSDREVSELLQEQSNNFAWTSPADGNKMCNKVSNHGNNGNYENVLMPDAYYDQTGSHKIKQFDSFGSHDQGSMGRPSASGQSESGYHTLTSQSTVDSGYITNDPDTDILSTSNYAKTLKQSAHSLYSSNSKLFSKPSNKGTNSQTQVATGDNSTPTNSKPVQPPKSDNIPAQPKFDNRVPENPKDSHTRNWVEQHPARFSSKVATSELKENTNNNSSDDHNSHSAKFDAGSDPNRLQSGQVIQREITGNYDGKKPATLSHRSSELTMKEIARLNSEARQFKAKGKSVSMSYGLNLIEPNLSSQAGGSYFSKARSQFTGSLKDLAQTEKYGEPVASLKTGVSEITASLQESWKSQGGTRTETSLKVLGKPSLFQLLQNYHLYPVRLKIPDNFKLLEKIRLVECEVVLPSPWSTKRDSPTLLSPQGSYAKLGGPNSAFTPVFGGSTTISSVAMVTVVEVASEMTEVFGAGQINKGDLIVEVNERLMMGEDLSVLTKNLGLCQGELLLTVARDKARNQTHKQNNTSPTEETRKLEAKLAQLTKQLAKRDRTLKQLTSLLPWKQSSDGAQNGNKHDLDIICNLSDDEFIV